MVFWDKRSLELVDLEVGLFSVLCCFKNVEDGFLWNFPKVYGSVLSSLREDFWDELGATRVLRGGGGGGGGYLMLSGLLVSAVRVGRFPSH